LTDPGTSRRIGLWLFAITSIVFIMSPVWVLGDSNYSMLLSENIIRSHSSYLNAYDFPGTVQQGGRCVSPSTPLRAAFLTYQLDRVRGNVVYCYPNGTSILSIPFVALMNAVGVHSYSRDGRCLPLGEGIMQRLLAALLMAGLAMLAASMVTRLERGFSNRQPSRPSERLVKPAIHGRTPSTASDRSSLIANAPKFV